MIKVMTSDLVRSLNELYRVSPTAKALFDWLAGLKKDVSSTSVDRAAQVTGEERGDVLHLFRQLSELEIGAVRLGRRGGNTRIEWEYSVRSLGSTAQGLTENIVTIDPVDLEDEPEDEEDESLIFLNHEFQLRPDVRVAIRLPADLSLHESERLASFVKSLPFG
jgi:hypothetical protein